MKPDAAQQPGTAGKSLRAGFCYRNRARFVFTGGLAASGGRNDFSLQAGAVSGAVADVADFKILPAGAGTALRSVKLVEIDEVVDFLKEQEWLHEKY